MRNVFAVCIACMFAGSILHGVASGGQLDFVRSSSEIEATNGVLEVITEASSQAHNGYRLSIRSSGEIEPPALPPEVRRKFEEATYDVEVTAEVAGSFWVDDVVITVLPALWGNIVFRCDDGETMWEVSPGNWGSMFARVLYDSSLSTGHILLPLRLTSGNSGKRDEAPVTVALSVRFTVNADRQINVDSIRLLDERGIGEIRVTPGRTEDLLPAPLAKDLQVLEEPPQKKTFTCCYSAFRCKCYGESGCPGICPHFVEGCGSPTICYETGCPVTCTN